MAKKASYLKMNPLMALSVFALFAMMIPMFSLANNNSKPRTSQAAQRVVVVTPSPSPAPGY